MTSRFMANRANLEDFIQNKAAKKALPSDVIEFIFDATDENWDVLNLLNKFFTTFSHVVMRSQADNMTLSEAVHLIDILEGELDIFLSSFFPPDAEEIITIR